MAFFERDKPLWERLLPANKPFALTFHAGVSPMRMLKLTQQQKGTRISAATTMYPNKAQGAVREEEEASRNPPVSGGGVVGNAPKIVCSRFGVAFSF